MNNEVKQALAKFAPEVETGESLSSTNWQLLNKQNNVVFSLVKESDLGANMISGLLKESGLGKLLVSAMQKPAIATPFDRSSPNDSRIKFLVLLPLNNGYKYSII